MEVQDAQSAVESAAEQRTLTQKRFASGEAPRGALLPHDRDLQEANLRLQRAKTLLDLYRKADPNPAAGEATPQNKPPTSPM